MWIVKLGGSLARLPELELWLQVLARFGKGNVVVVPGGGVFADQIRELQVRWKFSDSSAHRMALLAMEQYGLTLCAIEPELVRASGVKEVRTLLESSRVPVWFPYAELSGDTTVAHSWEVTSDSLSAWLTRALNAERLLLVKSCPLPPESVSVAYLARQGIVDRAFPTFLRGAGWQTWLLPYQGHEALRDVLEGSAEALCGATRVAA
jgi:5-(aminomethyl)-3-furanmethanol phosphate kinase